MAQALEAKDPSGFPLFERFVRAGVKADPSSGLWYAFAAIEANRLRLSGPAKEYAAKALRYPMDEGSRPAVEAIRGR